jgi:multiple sugar transport system permease protein
VLVIAPILLLFVFLQRYFIQGVATTGLKDATRRGES